MHRILIQDGPLFGALHLPAKKGPQPLVITLGGFRGGLNETRPERLASQGIASLALAYFGCGALPASLQEISLEYCEQAIEWAARHPNIDSSRIALWGVSRGAELALLLGSIFPDRIRAIAATVPSSATYGAMQTDAPAWIYRGSPVLPNAPFPKLEIPPGLGDSFEAPLALTPYFLEGMKTKAAFAASRIPVEKIQCPLLLVSGEDDQMWPSWLFSKQIAERLQEKGSSIPCVHFSYPGAGHAISSSEEAVQFHPVAKIWLAFGGNARDNAHAKADSWEKTVSFFQKWIF